MRLLFTISHNLNHQNFKPTKKKGQSDQRDWSDVWDSVIEFIIKEKEDDVAYGFSSRTALDFNQLLGGLKVGGDVYTKRGKEGKKEGVTQLILIEKVLDKLYAKLLDDGIVHDIKRRKPKSPGLGYKLFLDGDRRLRDNGQDKETGEWYKGPKEPLYTKELTFKEFIQNARNLDHVEAIADGGSDDLSNFEWATEGYNKWKSNKVIVN